MIVAENISYKAGGSVILDDVSVQIPNGKISAILGPNGAGKSTLLKCLTGSCQPDIGRVLIEDKPLGDYSLDALARKRAVLSQSNSVNFPFTALEIVMMGRHPYAKDRDYKSDSQVTQKALESVDTWHLKDRVFPTLSGGEQQRIQLARVLAQLWDQQDACLFLDEPTSALDLKHQYQLLAWYTKWLKQRILLFVLSPITLILPYAMLIR